MIGVLLFIYGKNNIVDKYFKNAAVILIIKVKLEITNYSINE